MTAIGAILRFVRRPPALPVDRVAPWLLIGPALDEGGYRRLTELGVTHVADLREEAADNEGVMGALGLRWMRLPIPDRAAPSIDDVERLIAWWEGERSEERALYLHCRAGFGRTPTVAIALLVHKGMPLMDAHRHVRAARPAAQPTEAQMAFLESFADRFGKRDSQ